MVRPIRSILLLMTWRFNVDLEEFMGDHDTAMNSYVLYDLRTTLTFRAKAHTAIPFQLCWKG